MIKKIIHESFWENTNLDEIKQLFKDKKFLEKNCGPNAAHHLIFSSMSKLNDPKILNFLIKFGIDFNNRSLWSNQISPLHEFARKSAYPETVEMLVQEGNDINRKDWRGKTPLFWAVQNENPAILQKLIELGGDINTREINGNNLIEYAFIVCENKNLSSIEVILENGGEIDENILLYSALNSCEECFNLSLNFSQKINTRDKNGETPLMKSTSNYNDRVIEKLLELGAKVNTRDKNGRNAFMHAAMKNSGTRIFRILRDAGCDINAVDAEGNNALMLAVKENIRADCLLEELFQLGVEVNAKDKMGRNAFMQLAMKEYEAQNFEILKNIGCDINAADKEGNNALFLAAKNNCLPGLILRVLLSLGVNPKTSNKEGESLFECLDESLKTNYEDLYWEINDLQY
jgi:ankyrin repeat protein